MSEWRVFDPVRAECSALLSSDLQVAACVQGSLIVQAVGPFVLRPAGLALLQRGAPASSARQLWLLPAGEVRREQSTTDQ